MLDFLPRPNGRSGEPLQHICVKQEVGSVVGGCGPFASRPEKAHTEAIVRLYPEFCDTNSVKQNRSGRWGSSLHRFVVLRLESARRRVALVKMDPDTVDYLTKDPSLGFGVYGRGKLYGYSKNFQRRDHFSTCATARRTPQQS